MGKMAEATARSILKKNALFSSLSFVLISGISFLTIPFIVSKMNFEIFGIYTLLTSLFGYFGIFDFGLGQGLIKFVSEYYATNQLRKISLAINTCLIFQVIIGLLLVILLLVFADEVVHLFNVSDQYFIISVKAFRLALLGLFISLVSAIFSSVMMGLQRYDLTSSVDTITNFLLNISLVGMLIYMDLDLHGAVLISVSFAFLTLVIYLVLIRKNLPFYRFKFEFDSSIVKQFIRFSINIFLSKLSALFSNHFVRFILSYFLSPTAVTFFVVPQKLLGAVAGMLGNGANTIFPYISSLNAQKNKEVIKDSFLRATSIFAAISIPAMLFLAMYSLQVLTIWMGNDFAEQTWLLLSIITISSLVGSFSAIPNLVVLGMGNSKLIALFSVISIILYLVFLPLLTAKFGLIGCAMALLIASTVSIGFVFKYTLKYMQVDFGEFLRSAYVQHLFPALLFIVLTILFKTSFTFTDIYFLVVGAVLISMYYFFMYQKVYLRLNKQTIK